MSGRAPAIALGALLLIVPVLALELVATGMLGGDREAHAIFVGPTAVLASMLWVPVAAMLVSWVDGRATTAIVAGLPLVVVRALPYAYFAFVGVHAGGLVFGGPLEQGLMWLATCAADVVGLVVGGLLGSLAIVRYTDFDGRRSIGVAVLCAGLAAAAPVLALALVLLLGGAQLAIAGAYAPAPDPGVWPYVIALVAVALPTAVLVAIVAAANRRVAMPLAWAMTSCFTTLALLWFAFNGGLNGVYFALLDLTVVSASAYAYGFFVGAVGFALGWLARGMPTLIATEDARSS
ncbi:MAG: hypothetical protein EP330_28595 [Deltaproteobacteria bacterium]|nr:MAG: hypothetical protein EP330_28595 [Deltaproteobacteria bacterium]